MSKTVDERVVEMRFDNKQFEANVKTSMSTLDKLKNSLKLGDASKGLENINKATKDISFESIASGVEALQKRFSTLGIVGMRVIENITDSMMNLASKATSFISDGVIGGGITRAMNLENAHFQLQGLLKDEEAVAAVMQNVNDSVDGTAYSLDSAAKVASQFAASGMRAGDQMFHSLRAVAGVAAMTNSEYDEIGRIFTKVAGQGRLMGDDLLSLSSRGMNAAATLGTYLGKSEAEVRDMVTKGKLDFQTFADAMDNAFGEHAKKANETFTGALSNIRAALARMGALFISPLVEQNGALVQLFNAVRERINDIKTAIQPVANVFVKAVTSMANTLTAFLKNLDIKDPIQKFINVFNSNWDKFSSKLESAGISMEDFQSRLTEVASKHGVSVDELINKYGSLGKVMSSGAIAKNIIVETLQSFVNVEKSASASADNITNKLETFNKVTREIINGNYGNGEARVKALTEAGYEYATMQKLVNYVWERNGKTWKDCNISADELTNTIGNLSSEELQSIGYTEEEAAKIRELAEEAEKSGTPLNKLIENMTKPSGKELIIDSFRNALKGLSSVMATVKSAWIEMVKPISTEAFSKVAERIHSFSQRLILSEENAEKLKTTFKGLFAALDLIHSAVGGALSTAFRVLSAVLSSFNLNILDVTAYVGEAVIKFRDWIKQHDLLGKTINTVVPIIKSAAEAVANWVKNNETIQNGIKNLKSILESVTSSIGKWIDGLKETDNIPQYIISGLVNGLKSGISTVANVMIEIGNSILSAIKKVLGIHSPSTEFFAIGENVIQGFINGVESGLSALFSLFGNIGQKCIDILSQIDFSKVFAVGISGGIIYTANNLLNTIKAFAAPAEGIGHMTNSIGSFFDALTENIKPNKWKNISKTVMELAIAIGVLSASVYVLAGLETDKLWGAIGALGALAAILGVLSFAVSKMDISGEGFGKLALVFVGLAASLYIMGSAIKKLEFLNEGNVAPVLGGLTAMIVGLTGILLALGKMTKGAGATEIEQAGTTMLKIAATMLLMTAAIKAISGLQPSEITKGIICMTLFGGLITGLMAATKLAGKGIGNLGSVILKISAAMLLMVGVIKVVSGFEPSEIAKGIVCMTLFGGLITGLMAATKLIGNNVGNIGSAIIGVSAAMMLMALTIKIVANMDPSSIAKGVICITLFGGIVTGLIAATRLAGGSGLKGVSATLLAMSLSIGILAGVAIVLSLIDIGGLAKGIIAVGLLSAMMTAMIYATKGAQDCKGNIIAMTVAIGLMTASIAALSFIDTGKLAAATIALSMVMGMFALVEKMASNISGAMGSILAISVAIGLLAGILYILSGIPAETLIPTAVSLSTLLLAMSGALAILSKIGSVSASAIGSMALMGLVVAELGAILGLMAHFNVQPSIETATSLSILLLAMSGALAILTLVGAGGPAAFIGIGALATLITAIGGLMVGIGALVTYIPDMQTWLNTGMAVLEQIGYGLGAFFGNIIGGLLGGMSSGLPEIGTNLSLFMTNMQPFLDGISGLDEGSVNNVKTLADAILALTGAGFKDSMTSWITGGSSLASFGEQLVPFGKAIKEYGDTVAGINTSGIQQSVTAGQALAELANALPNSGGIAGFFAGENNIDQFGEKLVPFGKAIKEYGDTVAGINTSGIQQSVDAGRALAELADALPESGGVAGFFAGENNIDQFGEKLVPFGKAIKEYGDAVSGINVSGIQQSVTAGQALSDLADSLPNSGGVAGFFAGNNDMDTFGANLVKFGQSLADFSNTVSGINVSGITAQLSGFSNALTELGNIGIDKFAASFENGSSKATSAITSMINGCVSSISGKAGEFQNAGTTCMTALVNAITSKSSSVSDAVKTIMSSAVSSIESYYNSFYNAGSYVASGLASGIRAGTPSAVEAARSMASQVAEAAKVNLDINSPSKVFMSIGKSVGEGFEKGISDKTQTSRVINSTVGLAEKVISSACDVLEINSPSRAFMAIGRYIGEGLAQGIRDSAWMVVHETEGAAEQIANVANSAFEDVEKWVEDKKAFDELSLAEELELWETVTEKYAEGTEERTKAEKKAYSVYKELLNERFQNSKNWIDQEKEYNRLTLQEELEAWKRVQSQYIDGTDERKEADKQVYKLEHELIDGSADLLQNRITELQQYLSTLTEDSEEYRRIIREIRHDEDLLRQRNYQHSQEWIQDQEDYDMFNLSSKLAANIRMLNKYGSMDEETRKKYEKEIYKSQKELYEAYKQYQSDCASVQNDANEQRLQLTQEYADKETEIYEQMQKDIEALDKEYEDALKSRTDSLYDAYGLFDEVSEKDKVSASTLMKNLQDQVEEFEDWDKTLDELSARGLNEALIEELQKMGPSAVNQIKALNSMSDSQLAQYASLWATKHNEAKSRAMDELEDMREETDTQIKALRDQAEVDLDDYTDTWNEKMRELDESVNKQLLDLRDDFETQVGIIKTDTEAQTAEMIATVQNIMLEAGWDEFGEEMYDKGYNGMSRYIEGAKDAVSSAYPSYVDELTGTVISGNGSVVHVMNREGRKMGTALSEGLANGIIENRGIVNKASSDMSQGVIDASKKTADINSPSKVFAEIGKYMVFGMAVGIEKYSKAVLTACSDTGKTAINAMSVVTGGIAEAVIGAFDEDLDIQPTITPVVDLTNVRNGIGMINGAFGANRGMSLAMAIDTNVQNGNANQSELFGKMQDAAEKANSKLSAAIDSLRADFNNMASKLESMQVVLDSGALVGEIAPDMDNALGGFAAMNRRGVR
ncbi:MAG: tape measure protein [bacterium]|nr:tape measure protein [bacterium]